MHGVEMGWDHEAKRFATAPLKEYPNQLNGCLASILLSAVDSPPASEHFGDEDGEFERFVARTSHFCQQLDLKEWGVLQPDWFRG